VDARVGNTILRARLWLLERRTHALDLCGNLALALIEGRALLLPAAPLDSVKVLTLLPVLHAPTQIRRYQTARTGAPHCDDPHPPAVCIRTPPTLMSEAGIVCTTGSRPKRRRSAHGY
jgi:hypothetical protein